MKNFLPLLADRIWNRPLLIDPGKAEVILAVLEGRLLPTLGNGEGAAIEGLDGLASRPDASRFYGSSTRAQGRSGLTRAVGSTAIITVDGSLVNRGAWIGANSGLTSYEGIGAQIDAAVNDGEINSILIDMNSFGGEATGMFSLAAKIRHAATQKRVVAVVNDVAASAGYGIVSAAHEIVVSPTSYVGSIGVVMMHLDRSGEMEMKGLKPSFIHAGAHKVDGHPYGALSADVRADLQSGVDTFYAQFLSAVASGRGSRLTADAARATEARVLIGQEAINAGLADRMGTFEEVLAELQRPINSGKSKQEMSGMGANNENTNGGISLDAHNAALSTARAEGMAAGATAEKARIKSIMTSEAAKGREATAQTFALDTDMSADDAVKVLATTPAIAPAAGSSIPTIEQRSLGAPEMGGSDPVKPSAEVVQSGWSSAFGNTNAS